MLKASIITAVLTGVITSTGALAGEVIKFKSHHSNVVTKWESAELGDEPGHIRANFEAKGIGLGDGAPNEPPCKVDIWGSGEYRKDWSGSDRGYTKYGFSDGSHFFEEWAGKVANGRNVGSGVYYGGGGRFKGIKGGSTYDCKQMGDRFLCDVEGTIEFP